MYGEKPDYPDSDKVLSFMMGLGSMADYIVSIEKENKKLRIENNELRLKVESLIDDAKRKAEDMILYGGDNNVNNG